ncbi:hypothetical protein ACFWVF_24115 [Streptomyces sp. NPDC058659]|uniref:hypothetical protein n=1 Tax=unclassified Streptomyces TaxID=2593676 RepID=UPI00364AC038
MRERGAREPEEPLPRDTEDQQTTEGKDPLSVPVPDEYERDEEPSGTDPAGTGPRGEPRDASVHPEHPIPDEPAD